MRKHDTLFEGTHIRLMRAGSWEYVQRNNISGIVVILPITDNDEAVLVRQFRAPVDADVIEWPAGLAGDVKEEEGLLEAAKRELLEETGYEARDWRRVADGPPSAGLSDEFVDFFIARGLTKTAEGGGDHTEDITVHLVHLDHLPRWLRDVRKDGVLIDPKIFAGLHLLHHPDHALFSEVPDR